MCIQNVHIILDQLYLYKIKSGITSSIRKGYGGNGRSKLNQTWRWRHFKPYQVVAVRRRSTMTWQMVIISNTPP